jgi:hypothetical protein
MKNNLKPDYNDWPDLLAIWHFAKKQSIVKPSPIANMWQKIVGDDPIIPFDMDERREKFKHAFKELEPYIKTHEALAEKVKSNF